MTELHDVVRFQLLPRPNPRLPKPGENSPPTRGVGALPTSSRHLTACQMLQSYRLPIGLAQPAFAQAWGEFPTPTG